MDDWLALLGQADVPVLQHTAEELERFRKGRNQLNASNIAHIVTDDPLMTVKLLRYMQQHKSRHQLQELLDVKQMLLMMGLDTFFRDVAAYPIVEDCLQDHPEALAELMKTVRRAQRSAWYAADWAQRMHDVHMEEVKVSALLTHVTEMLMWCFNPVPMLEIRRLQKMDPSLRSRDAQEQVLGFAGVEFQRRLTQEWQLPELLQDLLDPELQESPRVRNVMLAVRLARHSANGWHDAALPHDYNDIADLLHVEPNRVLPMVRTGSANWLH